RHDVGLALRVARNYFAADLTASTGRPSSYLASPADSLLQRKLGGSRGRKVRCPVTQKSARARLPIAAAGFTVRGVVTRHRKPHMAAVDRSIVANIPVFAGLSAGDLHEILREARSVRYPKDTSVFDQGTEAHSFFVLLHGHLRVEKTTPQGQQVVVRYVTAGELFGVAQAMALTNYPATAVAAVDSVALSWPSASWSRLVGKFPSLAAGSWRAGGHRPPDAQAS